MERNRHGAFSVIVVVYVVAAFYVIQIIPVLFQDFNIRFGDRFICGLVWR